jgi:hypothetical protein
VAGHVADGRRHLNFSTWDQPNEDLEEIEEQIEKREMPLWDYKLIHGEARLTDEEYDQLLAGIRATYATDPAVPRRRPGGFRREGGEEAAEGAEAAMEGADSGVAGMEAEDHDDDH